MMIVREPKYWSTNSEPDQLYHMDMNEAIHEFVIGKMPGEFPRTIQVHGFVHAIPKLSGVLDQTLEWLDEEYSDGSSTEPTENMKAAEAGNSNKYA